MIILLRPDAKTADLERLTQAIRDRGLDAVSLDEGRGRALEILGSDPSRVLELASEPGVATILTRRTALHGGEPLWPHVALRVGLLALLLLVVLLLLSAFAPPGLDDAATAAGPADGAAPAVEWYLRPLAWICGLSAGRIGGTLVLLFWLGLFLLPFLDRSSTTTAAGRWRLRFFRGAAAAIVLMFVLLALGVVS